MPTSKKARKIIAEDEVPRVFDTDCIERLAAICQFPPTANLFCFGEGMREAALLFARDAREPDVNQVHDEIAALWNVVDPARPPQWEAMTSALEALSPRTREIFSFTVAVSPASPLFCLHPSRYGTPSGGTPRATQSSNLCRLVSNGRVGAVEAGHDRDRVRRLSCLRLERRRARPGTMPNECLS